MRSVRRRVTLACVLTLSWSVFWALPALGAATVTRGPYLQLGTPTSIVVRWRTSETATGRVRYGTDPSNLATFSDGAVTARHEVTLTDLLPDTKYYYSVGTPTEALAGGDANHFFITSPPPGSAKPTRIWVLGDSGTRDGSQVDVRDAYLAFTGTRHTDLWLMLGDNAYPNGTDGDYQAAVFNMYPTMLRKSVLWPTRGNHDGADSENQTGPYYEIFTLPRQGEAGGLASGTEAYYSFDYGNIHFIVLESMQMDRSVDGPMMTWLKNDLAATTLPWVIAFWHHPPYSKGSHDSDSPLEEELVEMRENALPILEAGGVDLVLTGHSHSYERSFLIDGHYGYSSTFTQSMKKDGGSGREDGSGSYQKPSPGLAPHEGAVYAVAGSSGQVTGGGGMNHPAMFISLNTLGSMVLDVNGNRLDALFLEDTGSVKDYFTLVKGGSGGALPGPPANLTATAVSVSQIDLAWTDTADTEDGFIIEGSTEGSAFSQFATVGANVATYSATGLQPSTNYSFRVRAFNTFGSTLSNTASAMTLGAPRAASDLTATAVSVSQIDLDWTDTASNEDGFAIERSTDGINFSQVATVGPNVTTYPATGLQALTTYSFRVRAFNTFGNSAYSNTASATTPGAPPAAPSNLTAVAVSRSQVNLTWSDNAGNESGFKIQRSTSGGAFTQIATVGPNVTSYSNTGLQAGTKYRYRVRAYNPYGNSSFSNKAAVKTPP